MKASSRKAGDQGFNAVELLVVIVIIAAAAALVIPNISKISGIGADGQEQSTQETADGVKDLSNARNIVSMWNALAVTADSLPGTKEDCVDALLAGTNVAFAGSTTHYRLSGMSREDVDAAMKHIRFDGRNMSLQGD